MARERVAPPPPQSGGRGGQPVDKEEEETQATPPERGRARKKVIARRKGLKVCKVTRPRLRTKSDNSLSRSRNSEKKAVRINEQLKRNNTIMAKVVNQLKEALASRNQEIMGYKNEIMALNEEISILRVELEKYENEDGGFVKNQKAVRMCLNNAIDSFSSFASVFNEEIEKAYSVLNHGLKAARLSRNSRSRSSGRMLTLNGRESSQFSKPNSPNKQLPQNKVSPMVAGHPITTRPRIQLTRMTMPMTANHVEGNRESTEVERSENEVPHGERPGNARLPIRLAAPQRVLVLPDNVQNEEPQINNEANESLMDDGDANATIMENDDANVSIMENGDANASIMEDDVFDVHQEQFVQSRSNRHHQASPEPPRRTAFDMTVINEESYVASSPDTPASTSRVHLSRSLRMNNSVVAANQSTDNHHQYSDEENQSMMIESDNRNGNPNETTEIGQNTSVMDESLDSSFRRRIVISSNRRSRPILSGFAFANSNSGSSVSSLTTSLPENIRSPQLRASPQVDVLKSRRHLAVRLNNVSTDASAMSKTANLEALSPLGMNSSRSTTATSRGDSHTSLVGKSLVPAIDLNCSSLGDTTSIANRSSLADVTSIPVLADLDQTTDRLDISHAIKVNSSVNFGHNMTVGFNTTLTPTLVQQDNGSQSMSPAPSDVSLVENSGSNSPDSQEVRRSMSPEKRFDTSSVSFLESLDYDPMEGPSWLFESLRKRKKRKSAGSSSGSRKRRKATRRSSPFILDSPNLSGTKSTTPESSPSIVDASKFLSGLKASAAKSLSPGPENKSVNSDDEENISGFQQAPRRLSLDSSCLGAGSRTPLREITLEPQGEVFTYNPRVDSGKVVEGIREARINIRNTRTPEIQINRKATRQSEEIRTRSSFCKADLMNERQSLNLQNNTDNILGSTLLVQNISLEVDNLISSYNGEKVQIRTPKVNVSNDEVRRSRASLDIAQIQEVEDNQSNEEQIDIENIQKVVDQLSPAVPEKVENRRTSRRRTTLAEDIQALQAGNQGEAPRKSSKTVEKNDEIDKDDIQTVDDNRKKSTTSRLSKRASRKRHTSGKTRNQLDTIENDITKDVENEVNSVAKVGFSVTESEEIEEPTNDPLNNDSSKLTASKNIGKKATRGKSADSRLNVETDLELDKPSRTVRRVAGKSADSRLGLNTHFEDFGPSKTTEEDMKTSLKEDTRKSRKDEVRKSTREDIRKSTKRTSKIQNGAATEDDISVDEDDLVSIGSADSNSNYGGGESEDEMGEEGEGCGGRRPSRRATAKTSYAEPSLRRKMRQGDPGTSSVDPGFVPQIKKKTKK